MAIPKPVEKKYTYDDYLSWQDDQRWEIIDGKVYAMSPAPKPLHQVISRRITLFLGPLLEGKKCSLYYAPADVVFSEYNVVQPDIFVVCDLNKITDTNIKGAPDFIVEILSPSTAAKDQQEKKELYEKYGVKEYLLVDPDGQCVHRYVLDDNNRYGDSQVFDSQQDLPLASLPGIIIPLWKIFGIEKKEEE